jgi:HEAT repeat protein
MAAMSFIFVMALMVAMSVGLIALLLAALAAMKPPPSQDFRVWAAVASELGLSFTETDSERSISGMLNGASVRAVYREETKYAGNARVLERKLHFYAGGAGCIPASLALRKDSGGLAFARLVTGDDDAQIGDKQFDDRVELFDLDAYACAALSHAAREQLGRALEKGVDLAQSTLHCEMRWEPHDQVWLVQMLRWISGVGQLLSVTPETLHRRLAENAVRDPSPGVRLRNLTYLTDAATRSPPTLIADAARALLSDGNAPIRLLAAKQLGAQGCLPLLGLAADVTLGTALRAEAVQALGAQGGAAFAPALASLSGDAAPEVVRAALAAIAAQHLTELAPIVQARTQSPEPGVRASAAAALASLVPAVAEATLIGLLSDPSADVQLASVEALGEVGTVTAVEPLLPVAQGFGRPQLRRAARAAIGRIQSRLGPAEAGLLSLAVDHALAGAVDLADPSPHAGELSLAELDAEQAISTPRLREES